MKKLVSYISVFFVMTFMLISSGSFAQFNNEWIDFSKTYFKFKVGETGLYRIPFATLQSNGLSNVPANQFQLWRNGKEVALYTSIDNGLLGANDFIEFFGTINDGKPDAPLYKKAEFQLADKWSLQTDTAVYFLTTNSSSNARLTNTPNVITSNTIPAEPYFMHKLAKNYKDQINPGYASIVGIYVYSSSYDNGEGWTSRSIAPSSPLVDQYNDLFVANSPLEASLKVTAFGNALNIRSVQVAVNGSKLIDQQMDYFNATIKEISFPSNLLGRSIDTIRIANQTATNSDRMVVGKYELTYPRQFNFGGSSLFEFTLPGSSVGNYLEIINFNSGAVAPILYDLSEGKRYIADVAVAGKFRIVLPPGGLRNFVLLNASATQVKNVATITKKTFTDFSQPANQGNYLMISHPSLGASSNGNALDNYRLFRSSVIGGGYQAKIFDIDELVDQFAFGIKKHPSSVKNFINYARQFFASAPKNVLLVGRGLTYDQYRINESRPITERINIIPTFGSPGSDNILASTDNDPTAEIAIGRLSVTKGDEINAYLEKVKQHDLALNSQTNTVKEKAWMKNFAHVIGGGDPYLQSVIDSYMKSAGNHVQDTSLGAQIYTFNKLSAAAVEQVNSGLLSSLFSEGLGMLTYFGHSSANSMEFNLDDPSIFDNQGKYPLFIANGCNAGNFFTYDTLRVTTGKRNISENYVLMPNKGSIGFIASTHYGIVNYLNLYTNIFYRRMAREDYQSTIGDLQKNVSHEVIASGGNDDFYNVMTMEQMLLGGDPAVRLYPHPLPDFAVEDPLIRISPTPLSVTNSNFDLKVKYYNLGKAVNDSVRLQIKREMPDGSLVVLYDQNRGRVYASDSVSISVPINPYTDRGQNKIIVQLDSASLLNEITRSNNNVTKSFSIAEDEVRPVYPLNFAIVNSNKIKLTATTNQFLQVQKSFIVEVDTTENFNSPIKVSQTQSSIGGVIEFSPVIPLKDSVVFYWRVAKVPDTGVINKWSNSSFVYIPTSSTGWSQSHYFQYLKDTYNGASFIGRNLLNFEEENTYQFSSGLIPYFGNTVRKNLELTITNGCGLNFNSIEFVILNSFTGKLTRNKLIGSLGVYNSSFSAACSSTNPYQFYYSYNNSLTRKYAANLFDSIPNGTILIMSNWVRSGSSPSNQFIDVWKGDKNIYGVSNSLYDKLKSVGITKIDSFYHEIPFLFIVKKDVDGSWKVLEQQVGNSVNQQLKSDLKLNSYLTKSSSELSLIGPAKSWTSIHWKGYSLEPNSSDDIKYNVYGVGNNFSETLLYSSSSKQKDTSLSYINASIYPYLKIYQQNIDTANHTPWQTKYLQVKYEPVPEGALTPASQVPIKDTLDVGEPIKFNMAFKNISSVAFDSVKLFMSITDPINNTKVVFDGKRKPIKLAGDTILVDYTLDTKNMVGDNSVYINFNPDNAQPEQYMFNNYLNKNIYVRPDTYAPNLDVTFDGLHILNKDIVSPKPTILVKLKDDSKFLALNDTSLFSVKLRYPDGSLKAIKFDNDTLVFTPAMITAGSSENTATVTFKPYLREDGEYELIVSGKDRSNNVSGAFEYRVMFEVYNKSMITNLLNYPNPFTSSTAFVFTLTGSELPSGFRIQILTVTGKIVKEIVKEELGPIRIGNNITEYKWDGTDMFGQPLANGVYLYRVITDIRGKKIDKFNTPGFNTEKYFQSGYGKMYLMR
jgi:hypothetical protein